MTRDFDGRGIEVHENIVTDDHRCRSSCRGNVTVSVSEASLEGVVGNDVLA